MSENLSPFKIELKKIGRKSEILLREITGK